MLLSLSAGSVAGQWVATSTDGSGVGHGPAGKGCGDDVAHAVRKAAHGRISNMFQRAIDISGQRFNHLTAIEPVGRRGTSVLWRCHCDCGRETAVGAYQLRAGEIKSCGCAWTDKVVTHGMSKSPEYRAWAGMIGRCENPTNKRFSLYGGRGIRVCARWRNSFEAFHADMGPRPSNKHSIDRIDVDGGYSPENCRWADQKTQCRNRRSNVRHTAHGLTLTVPEWAEHLGIPEGTLRVRMRRGLPPEKVFSDRNVRYGSVVQSKRR